MYYLKKTLRGIELIFYQEKSPDGLSQNPSRTRSHEYEAAQRAKREIIDLTLSNQWDYMFTQTINPKNYDRYNYEQLKEILIKRLDNYKQRYDSNLKFIIIPELHRDKAIHFHGLLKFKIPPKHLEYIKNRNGAEIYKHTLLDSMGFNELAKIYNHQEFVAYYVSKYITKGFGKKITNKRYYRSQDLDKPQKYYFSRDKDNWRDIQLATSLAPSYVGQFATKWQLTNLDAYAIFKYNDKVKEFLKS